MAVVDTAAWLGMATALTMAEYLALPEDARVEIVDGVVRPMTRSSRKGRNIQSLLAQGLRAQARHGLIVLEAEVVVLTEVPALARIPDVTVIRAAPTKTWSTNNTPARDVLLAVEIVSPSSITVDRREKPVDYALAGIPAFWLVETDPTVTITVHRLTTSPAGPEYQPVATFDPGQTVHDITLPWVNLHVDDLGHYDEDPTN